MTIYLTAEWKFTLDLRNSIGLHRALQIKVNACMPILIWSLELARIVILQWRQLETEKIYLTSSIHKCRDALSCCSLFVCVSITVPGRNLIAAVCFWFVFPPISITLQGSTIMLFSPCRSYMHLPCQYFQLSVFLNSLNYVIDLKKTLALTTIYVSEHFLIMLVVHICTCPVNMFSDIFFNRLATL